MEKAFWLPPKPSFANEGGGVIFIYLLDISSNLLERKVSISEFAHILTTLSASIRCCRAPVPIDCRLECEEHGGNPMDQLLV